VGINLYKEKIEEILQKVKKQDITVDEAMQSLRGFPYEDLDFAKVDHHRSLNKGFPEVIYSPGKTTEQIIEIAGRLLEKGADVLATRAEHSTYEQLQRTFNAAEYHEMARAIVIYNSQQERVLQGQVVVMAAGTADLPVAEEAALTAEIMGSRVIKAYDVGVAGIHRLFDYWEEIKKARSIVAVAGMEGALPSVIGGIAGCPVIAVPTSVGYGASFNGLAPLLTMLNTCASGVAVVNIDNGFGGGYTAALINLGQTTPE